ETVVALVSGKGGKGGAADRGEETAQEFGIDGAGAFEPAAVIYAAFVQDRRVVGRRGDAVEQFAHGLVVAGRQFWCFGHEAHTGTLPLVEEGGVGGLAEGADGCGDVGGAQRGEKVLGHWAT